MEGMIKTVLSQRDMLNIELTNVDNETIHFTQGGSNVIVAADEIDTLIATLKLLRAAGIIEKLGGVITDVDTGDLESVGFGLDGYECSIDASEVVADMSKQDLYNRCTMFSCCGDVLDKDRMLCPTCKEHC